MHAPREGVPRSNQKYKKEDPRKTTFNRKLGQIMMAKRVQKRCGRAPGGMACAAARGRQLPPEPWARRAQVTLTRGLYCTASLQ